MRNSFVRIKGVGFLVWHGRHYLFHILIGLMWAWFLRELWQEFNTLWIITAVVGSVIPDFDHMLYFTTYGKRDPYTRAIITFLKTHQWRVLVRFIETGHKYNTSLTFHNFYITAIVFCFTIVSFTVGWRFWTFLFGAMVTHYIFDVLDDWVTLGKLNPNWKRWGRGKRDNTLYNRSN
jgi:hypothetical protein